MPQDVLKRVVAADHLGGTRLRLRFDDGVMGDVDLRDVVRFRGLMKPLEDPAFVAQVGVDEEFGSVVWPGDVDVDPVVLYCAVKRIPVPEFGTGTSKATRRTPTRARKAAVRKGKRPRRGAA